MADTKEKRRGSGRPGGTAVKKKSAHAGHRSRMRSKLRDVGFEGWSQFEILEYMLYYVLAGKNTNEIAHDLLSYSCGGVAKVLKDACDGFKLCDVDGVGEETILYLRSLKYLLDYCRIEELKSRPLVFDRESINDIISILDLRGSQEKLVMLCLDRAMRVKNMVDITTGSDMYSAGTSVDRIVSCAANAHAANVVLIHNHPSGCAKISSQDILMTNRTDALLKALGIFLVDHFIVADNKMVSVKMSEHRRKMSRPRNTV